MAQIKHASLQFSRNIFLVSSAQCNPVAGSFSSPLIKWLNDFEDSQPCPPTHRITSVTHRLHTMACMVSIMSDAAWIRKVLCDHLDLEWAALKRASSHQGRWVNPGTGKREIGQPTLQPFPPSSTQHTIMSIVVLREGLSGLRPPQNPSLSYKNCSSPGLTYFTTWDQDWSYWTKTDCIIIQRLLAHGQLFQGRKFIFLFAVISRADILLRQEKRQLY